jgi:hypothetical protein
LFLLNHRSRARNFAGAMAKKDAGRVVEGVARGVDNGRFAFAMGEWARRRRETERERDREREGWTPPNVSIEFDLNNLEANKGRPCAVKYQS